MIHCDLCDKKINSLKDAHHSIPLNNDKETGFVLLMCDDCYKKFRDDLKRMEDEE